jgi:hypothetical protein
MKSTGMTRRKQKKVQSLQRAAKYMLLKYKSIWTVQIKRRFEMKAAVMAI